ncbi:uncharacterized protein ARMOST_20917 [Armillaria ostoyae]|uniref:Uncharacterized protein n=1 Tax=Armillaria ostoyae TaxID=47428 RepID=A0A284S8M2_ARMOS|nr:uncharacterized protein ARMOST_20917 [Armillaria ostoyae]
MSLQQNLRSSRRALTNCGPITGSPATFTRHRWVAGPVSIVDALKNRRAIPTDSGDHKKPRNRMNTDLKAGLGPQENDWRRGPSSRRAPDTFGKMDRVLSRGRITMPQNCTTSTSPADQSKWEEHLQDLPFVRTRLSSSRR